MLSYRFFHQLFSDPKGTFDEAMENAPLKKAFSVAFFISLSIGLFLLALSLIIHNLFPPMWIHYVGKHFIHLYAFAGGFILPFAVLTFFSILLIPAIITLLGKIFRTEISFKKAVLAYVLPLAGYLPLLWITAISLLFIFLMKSVDIFLALMSAPIVTLAVITFIWVYYTSLCFLKYAFGLSLFASLWIIMAPFTALIYLFLLAPNTHILTISKTNPMGEIIEKIETKTKGNFITGEKTTIIKRKDSTGKITTEVKEKKSIGTTQRFADFLGLKLDNDPRSANPDIERYSPDNISEEVKNRPQDEFNISAPTSDQPSG